MRLRLDFEASTAKKRHYPLVCIKRGKKERIVYNSGMIYFEHREALIEFKKGMRLRDPKIEIIEVDVYQHHEPGMEKGPGYWCPYCQRWEYWNSSNSSKYCPICLISNSDYWVKQYNHLWNSKMQNKTTQKRMEKVKTKNRKRKKVD